MLSTLSSITRCLLLDCHPHRHDSLSYGTLLEKYVAIKQYLSLINANNERPRGRQTQTEDPTEKVHKISGKSRGTSCETPISRK